MGALALEIEQNILDWWRADQALPIFLASEEMPQGGWTETVELELDLAATMRRINMLATNQRPSDDVR